MRYLFDKSSYRKCLTAYFRDLIFLSVLVALVLINSPSGALSAVSASVYDQTILIKFPNGAIDLAVGHEAKIAALLRDNPYGTEITCTGVRVAESTRYEAIKVKKRALKACEEARLLNPSLEIRVLSKLTSHSRYRGSVILGIKSPQGAPAANGFVRTDAIEVEMISNHRTGDVCVFDYGWPVLGADAGGRPVYLKCVQGRFLLDPSMPSIDIANSRPVIPLEPPLQTTFSYSPHLYIEPQVVNIPVEMESRDLGTPDVSGCKISELDDGAPSFSFGFPLPTGTPQLSIGLKVLVLPVSFTDFPSGASPRDDMSDARVAVSHFYERVGEAVPLEWTIPAEYRPLPRSLESFGLNFEFDPSFQTDFWAGYRPYVQYVIDQFDAEFDFDQFDIVVIEEPRSVPDSLHGMSIPYVSYGDAGRSMFTSDEGEVNAVLITGNDETRDIPNWIHQFGHLLGLPDRNWTSGASPGFDIMWGWYGAPELAAWNRWLLGVIDDSQIFCKSDPNPEQILIQPLAWGDPYRLALVIPLSEHSVVVAESRRRQGYDSLLGLESEGLYVYKIDSSAAIYADNGSVPVDVVAPDRSQARGMWSFDASLKVGESVRVDGWCIEVVQSGNFGDLVDVRSCDR